METSYPEVEPSLEPTGAPRRHRSASQFIIEVLLTVVVAGDLLFFMLGLVGAFELRFDLPPLRDFRYGFEKVTIWNYGNHLIFGTVFFSILAGRSGLYAQENILRARRVSIGLMNTAVFWTLGYLFVSLLFYFQPPISRVFVLLGTVCGTFSVLFWRYLFNACLVRGRIYDQVRQRILVVGWNIEAQRLADSVRADTNHPYEIIGCLPSAHNEYKLEPPPQIARLGDYQRIGEFLRMHRVDIVLIADLDPKTREIIALCEFCNREMIPFKIIPTYFQILVSGLHLDSISGVPVLGVARLPLDSLLNRGIKRVIDLVGAVAGLVLAVPIFLIFGTLVYIESPGPIIYRQVREGRNGRPFTIYKIRSMRLDAEKDGPQWSPSGDSRCLRIGAFLRRWNLDEFPQFWNVLTGEMSLVGPRPERPELIENFKDRIRHYNARHHVKPGVTGWAQINGLRGDTDLNERIRYDLYYLENWSPILDFYIMLRTFWSSPLH